MAVNAEIQKRMADEEARGVPVGNTYRVETTSAGQKVYTDAGVFETRKNVPGAYFWPDALAVPPFRGRPA